jgi:hypothetical protein
VLRITSLRCPQELNASCWAAGASNPMMSIEQHVDLTKSANRLANCVNSGFQDQADRDRSGTPFFAAEQVVGRGRQ